MRLSDFEVGLKGRIVFIVSSETSRLNKLGSMGDNCRQCYQAVTEKPSFVIQIDETSIAVDPEIAKRDICQKAV